MSIEHWDNPLLNKKMLDLVQNTIQQLEQLYEGRAKSFANVLHDMHQLEAQFKEKLLFEEPLVGDKVETEEICPGERTTLSSAETKHVYVRLFHREMANLTVAKASKSWIKPLLESVRSSEKLGLAVYGNEEDAKKSLRSEFYGYATLTISSDKDITEQRPAKKDDKLGCSLLTLAEISLEDITQFSYQGKDYPIIKGVMRITPQNDGQEE